MSEQPQASPPPFESWAVVELFGHRVMAGRVTEEQRFGGTIGRCDVFQEDGTYETRYFGSGSVYAMTPCSEDVARRYSATHTAPLPVGVYRPQLPAPPQRQPSVIDMDEDEMEDYDGPCSSRTDDF